MRSVLAITAERIGLLLFISSQSLQHGDAFIRIVPSSFLIQGSPNCSIFKENHQKYMMGIFCVV
jgi:hypothetical protein